MKLKITIGAGTAAALLSTSVFAQDATEPVAAEPYAEPTYAEPAPEPAATADASASTSGSYDANSSYQFGVGLPSAAPEPAAGASDHSQMVGRFAVGYLGRQTMQIASGVNGATDTVSAPVIGVRYWLDNMIGIDAGLGFNISSVSVDNNGTETDVATPTTFILHAGVPLNLADTGHFSFQIVPEANIGFAGATDESGPDDADLSGFHLSLGARAGAEVSFGFMDIPQLSLQGGVGLYLQYDSTSYEAGAVESSASAFSIGTTRGSDPWDIFTSSISALYYF